MRASILLPAVVLLAAALPLHALERGAYRSPDLEGFLLTDAYDADGDGDDVKETRVRRYRNKSGDKIFNMSIKGVLWAWSLNTHGDDDSDIEKNYVIRDGNCDGLYDERYALDEEFHVPPCLKRQRSAQ